MNVASIVIIILIIILIYILYFSFYLNTNNLNSYLNLSSSAKPTIVSKDIINPNSTTYSYSFWLCINQPKTTSGDTILINRQNEMEIFLSGTDLQIKLSDAPSANGAINIFTIYKMVPSQKWIYVIINRTPTMLEIYINGKLNFTQNVKQTSSTYGNITFGKYDAYISKLQRWTTPITPSEALKMYYSGSGYNFIFPNLNVTASVLHNNIVQKHYALF